MYCSHGSESWTPIGIWCLLGSAGLAFRNFVTFSTRRVGISLYPYCAGKVTRGGRMAYVFVTPLKCTLELKSPIKSFLPSSCGQIMDPSFHTEKTLQPKETLHWCFFYTRVGGYRIIKGGGPKKTKQECKGK